MTDMDLIVPFKMDPTSAIQSSYAFEPKTVVADRYGVEIKEADGISDRMNCETINENVRFGQRFIRDVFVKNTGNPTCLSHCAHR